MKVQEPLVAKDVELDPDEWDVVAADRLALVVAAFEAITGNRGLRVMRMKPQGVKSGNFVSCTLYGDVLAYTADNGRTYAIQCSRLYETVARIDSGMKKWDAWPKVIALVRDVMVARANALVNEYIEHMIHGVELKVGDECEKVKALLREEPEDGRQLQ